MADCVRNRILALLLKLYSTIFTKSRWNDYVEKTLVCYTVTWYLVMLNISSKKLCKMLLWANIEMENWRSSCAYCILGCIILCCVSLGKCSRSPGQSHAYCAQYTYCKASESSMLVCYSEHSRTLLHTFPLKHNVYSKFHFKTWFSFKEYNSQSQASLTD